MWQTVCSRIGTARGKNFQGLLFSQTRNASCAIWRKNWRNVKISFSDLVYIIILHHGGSQENFKWNSLWVGSQHAGIGFGAAVVLHASAASAGCVVAMFNLTSTLEPLKTRSSFKSWIHPHLASEHGDHKAIGQEPTSLSTIYPHEWVNVTCLYLYLILWMQLW